ncbi:hypothetical protein AB0H00_24350 [Nocardia sp. NPDC023852]|uniref:hypothetical protein n=1 Tax=Nocardia sp. NPDC023852 TaxID=3154697 RepID=UPI0033DCF917
MVAIILPSYVADALIKNVDLAHLLPMRGRITLPAQAVGRTGDDEMIALSLHYSAARDTAGHQRPEFGMHGGGSVGHPWSATPAARCR